MSEMNPGFFIFVLSHFGLESFRPFTFKSTPANWIQLQPHVFVSMAYLLKDVLEFLKEPVYSNSHSGPQSVGLSKAAIELSAPGL